MKQVTTSLYAIAKHTFGDFLTAQKEYPVFKISHSKDGERITIINDRGDLESWGTVYFNFITK